MRSFVPVLVFLLILISAVLFCVVLIVSVVVSVCSVLQSVLRLFKESASHPPPALLAGASEVKPQCKESWKTACIVKFFSA